jgi:glycosyltransferase involved in cell wall biosynthesis
MSRHGGIRPRGVVYTCLFGFSEEFADHRYEREDIDFICFTDDPELRSEFWDIRLMPPGLLDPARAAKRIKHLPHRYFPDYEWSLYIDNTVLLKIAPKEIYRRFLQPAQSSMVCFRHGERNCVYDEAEAVLGLGYDEPYRVRRQMEYYEGLGYPRGNGLLWSAFLLRRHHDGALIAVMEQWHDQVLMHSLRDQLSLAVVLHYNHFTPKLLELDFLDVVQWPVLRGARLPRDFDDARYLQLNPDVSINARKHYLLRGHEKCLPYKLPGDERSADPYVLRQTIADRDKDIEVLRGALAEARLNERFGEIATLTRLLREEENTARRAADEAEWMRQTAAVLLGGGSWRGKLAWLLPGPAAHALRKIQLKRRGLFDARAYLRENTDVARLGADALRHYINFGIKEGGSRARARANERTALKEAVAMSESIWRVSVPVRWAGRRLAPWVRGARMVRSLSRRAGRLPRLVSLGWHVFLRSGISGVASKLRVLKAERFARFVNGDPYERIAQQIFEEQQAEVDRVQAVASIGGFARTPLISVIMPVYGTPIKWLRRAVESLQEQYYENWELCVVDDCSPTDKQRELLKDMAAQDARIRIKTMEKNSGISSASNAALAMARGEFIALLDHDDELPKDALYWIASEINRQPDADFIYTDECKIDDTSRRGLFHFVFKPDWSPEIMFNGMLTGHLAVYSTEVVRGIGGFRSKYDFSQDYDLALRMSEVARKIVHVERVLYLWRSISASAAGGGKDFARESNVGALNDALVRRSIPGVALPLEAANSVRIAIPDEKPPVSIIIPSDSAQSLRTALDAIRAGTEYPNFEVVVVCNGPLAERLKDEYADVPQFVFVHYNKAFNFSDKCNEGARAANGEFVVFYNDDVFPTRSDWIERLIEFLYVPGVEGASPKLLHENNTIQYAGMISGTPGLVGTAYNNVPHDGGDSFLSMHRYVRNVSVLSGACCALRRDIFWAVGGFDAVNTPDGHSDMDLSYKLIRAGYRCVYTPYSVLHHVGNHSWNAKREKYKADIFVLKRWGAYVSRDPNFTDSMKRVLYREFPFQYRIFAAHVDPDASYEGPDVLFVSHELSLTGAPRMLIYAGMAVRQKGGFPVVVAPTDGPIRAELEAAGIVVIVDGSVRDGHFLFERFARNFDVVVVNTLTLANVVRRLSAIDGLDVVWWLHEAKAIAEEAAIKRSTEWERVRIVCNSEYAHKYLPGGARAEVLHYGIPDRRSDVGVASRPERMTFVLAGTLERRKAQDIFVEAIALLPEGVRKNCQFLLTGKLWEGNRSYWELVQATMAILPECKYLGPLNHRDMLDVIAHVDVLVCCSRDEPFSLVVMEAAMLGKPSILSANVGIVDLLKHGRSCAIFESGNASALAKQMRDAFENRDAMARMGQAARQVFERELTLEAFSERFFQKALHGTNAVRAPAQKR